MSNEEMNIHSEEEFEDERDFDGEDCFEHHKHHECHECHECHVPPIKIGCDLEITVGPENKIIYVCPGRVQYFTARALCCPCDKTIELEYCGNNVKCICGEAVICGCLGFYRIVNSGIVFIPRHKLAKVLNNLFLTDTLCFKVKNKDIKFDVIFSHTKSIDCCCNRNCKINKC